MAIGDEEIVIAVVVVIEKTRPPAQIGDALLAQGSIETCVGEETSAIVLV